MKKTYASPTLTVWGTLAELTQSRMPDGYEAQYALSDGSSVPTITDWNNEEERQRRKKWWEDHHWTDPKST